MSNILASLTKTVSVAGTGEVLGTSAVRFTRGQFLGYSAVDTPNTGDVHILQGDGGPRIATIPTGQISILSAPENGFLSADILYVDADTNGDGVVFQYQMDSFKTWNNVESKLESAMRNICMTISARLHDVSFTTGFSVEKRSLPNVNCSVSGASERALNSGSWECAASVEVRSDTDEVDADVTHSMRVAYIRDLFLDSMISELLSSAEPNFFVQGVTDRQTNQSIDGRVFVSDLTMSVIAAGKNLE
jgi:hypothetical protein